MKLIIAGSRTIKIYWKDIDGLIPLTIYSSITEIISGGALGVDSAGEAWARQKSIKITRFLPDWNTYGKKAGPLRNIEMAKYADALLLIWDGKSRGSRHMKKSILDLNKPFYEYIC